MPGRYVLRQAPLADGGRLSYVLHGSDGAPALLLLRPLGGSMALWGAFRELLAERFCVVSFDPRGIGDSGPARRVSTTRAMAADACSLLDHLGIPRAHVFGLSLGGMVACQLALDAPQRVDRLIVASAAASGADFALGVLLGLRMARCLALAGPRAGDCLVRLLLSSRFRARHPRETRRIANALGLSPPGVAAVLSLVTAAARHDLRERLPLIRAPTLVLYGSEDRLLWPGARETLIAGLSGARSVELNGAGHDLSLERPLGLARWALAFLGESGHRGPELAGGEDRGAGASPTLQAGEQDASSN